jgi:hypothetical protein
MVFWMIIKGVIDVKSVHEEKDSLHFRREKIKTRGHWAPGGSGTRSHQRENT